MCATKRRKTEEKNKGSAHSREIFESRTWNLEPRILRAKHRKCTSLTHSTKLSFHRKNPTSMKYYTVPSKNAGNKKHDNRQHIYIYTWRHAETYNEIPHRHALHSRRIRHSTNFPPVLLLSPPSTGTTNLGCLASHHASCNLRHVAFYCPPAFPPPPPTPNLPPNPVSLPLAYLPRTVGAASLAVSKTEGH